MDKIEEFLHASYAKTSKTWNIMSDRNDFSSQFAQGASGSMLFNVRKMAEYIHAIQKSKKNGSAKRDIEHGIVFLIGYLKATNELLRLQRNDVEDEFGEDVEDFLEYLKEKVEKSKKKAATAKKVVQKKKAAPKKKKGDQKKKK